MPTLAQSYQILGLDHNSNKEAVRNAFRKLACETHPDLHPDDPAAGRRFARLAEAYATILAHDQQQVSPVREGQRSALAAIRPWAGVDVRIGESSAGTRRDSPFATILSHYMSDERRHTIRF